MIIGAVVVYLICCIPFFYLLVKKGKKDWGYVDKEDLFFITLGALLFPLLLSYYVVYEFYNWLELKING